MYRLVFAMGLESSVRHDWTSQETILRFESNFKSDSSISLSDHIIFFRFLSKLNLNFLMSYFIQFEL